MVSYARSTYEKSKEFNKRLKELQETIDPITIRTYLSSESKIKMGDIGSRLDLSDDEKLQLDELKALRMDGIQSEMQYALAQAKKNGIKLPENIVSGESIVPGFSQTVLDKVPSLGVYNLFMLFTEKELDTYLQKNNQDNKNNNPIPGGEQR